MSDGNTQDGAEPSPASAGSRNTDMATARLVAANTWLQDEIKRLRITAIEEEAIRVAIEALHRRGAWAACERLRGLLERLT